jgi:hypothetical protein
LNRASEVEEAYEGAACPSTALSSPSDCWAERWSIITKSKSILHLSIYSLVSERIGERKKERKKEQKCYI